MEKQKGVNPLTSIIGELLPVINSPPMSGWEWAMFSPLALSHYDTEQKQKKNKTHTKAAMNEKGIRSNSRHLLSKDGEASED